MSEKAYNTMKHAGGWNIALGVISLVMGVGCGVLLIVCGAKLLGDKKGILL